MNIMVKFNKEMFINVSKKCDNFDRIVLHKDKNHNDVIELTIDNIEDENIWFEFFDDKEDIKNSTFIVFNNDKNKFFTTNDLFIFNKNKFAKIKIFDFYSSLYEEIYNHISKNIIPFKD